MVITDRVVNISHKTTKNYQKNIQAFSMRYQFKRLYDAPKTLKILSRLCNVVLRFVMSSIGSDLRKYACPAQSGALFTG